MSAGLEEIARLSRHVLLAGKSIASLSDTLISVIDPATEQEIADVAEATDVEVDEALDTANQAWRGWFAQSALERTDALHRAAAEIRKNARLLAEMMTREMGKPYKEAADEVEWSASAITYYAEIARHENGKVLGNTVPGQFHFVTKEPLGVVGIILPFNYPLVLLAWQMGGAVAAGNAVVVKPSEQTTLTTLRFLECFSGLPAGVVNMVSGGGRVGARIVESPIIRMIVFTGSVSTGQIIARVCAESFKRCLIEASGNDPFIVSAKAKLEPAVPGLTFAAFLNAGQVCTSAERIFVESAIHDEFVERFAAETRKLRLGSGLEQVDIGPMATHADRERTEAIIRRAVEQGARVVCGGSRPTHVNRGYFLEPTILVDVRPDMEIMNEESFGPIAPVCRVESFDEAIRLANQSRFGLGANVYTSDLAEAMRAVNELEAGMVWVNAPLLDNAAGPFGGRKMSGMGRQLGSEGLDAFRETKFAIIDPAADNQDFWWFPYKASEAFRSLNNGDDNGR
ncbi:MAG: aldehyde dehydrogenase [Chitinophagales bacterium]|nr:aldehyde dehydrogenase [Hyphomicrobiales bacterium]